MIQVALLALCISHLQQAAIGHSTYDLRPPVFTDLVRYDCPRVATLGNVQQLNTIVGPKRVDALQTKVSIFNRRGETRGIGFRLVDPCSEKSQVEYHYDLPLILESNYNVSSRTIIMVAGFLSDEVVPWMEEARELWLAMEDVNVIQVSWSGGNKYLYSTAVAATPIVARQITIFLYYMAAIYEMDYRGAEFAGNIHFIGHSLGAHIGGFLGQDLGGKLGRITGLDPAGPSFDQYKRSERLDKTDAKLVDVIHTNGGRMRYAHAAASAPITAADSIINKIPLLNRLTEYLSREYAGDGDTAWFGIDQQVGHVDYYANDGRVQPGCSGLLHVCNHNRATEIYVDILKYEYELRWRHKIPRYTNRLLAFSANDFDQFASGRSLDMHCPAIMHIGEHLSERVKETLRSCSVPIDLVSPPDVFRKELDEKYGIPLDQRDYRPAHQYYFKTAGSDKQPYLVGGHYMLKLYLEKSPTWPRNECAFKAEIYIGSSTPLVVEMTNLEPTPDGSLQRVIALPFIYPDRINTRATVYEIIGQPTRNLTIAKLQALKREVLPSRMKLSITDVKSRGVLGAIKNKAIKMIYGDKRRSNCAMSIGMIEVQPVLESGINFSGLYSSDDLIDPNSSHLNVFTQQQQVDIPWLEERLSRLSLNSICSITRDLAALVISE